jgi:polyhydroxyalkanoate synthesis regulator phasin
VLESYERFVAALEREDEDRRPSDSHWKLQTELLGDAAPALNHIGRVEALGDTLKLLGEHVAPFGKELPPMRRENVTPLPYPGGLLSEETARVIREYYAPDYRAFDYPEPEASPPSEEAARGWKERVGILLDSVRLLISHNERLNTLNESMQDARRQAATTRKNSEGLRREAAKRDKQVVRFRNRANSLEGQVESLEGQVESLEGQVESLEGQVESLEGQVESLRESLQKIQGSGTWRYTAPARRLIEEARRAKGRLQGGGTPG